MSPQCEKVSQNHSHYWKGTHESLYHRKKAVDNNTVLRIKHLNLILLSRIKALKTNQNMCWKLTLHSINLQINLLYNKNYSTNSITIYSLYRIYILQVSCDTVMTPCLGFFLQGSSLGRGSSLRSTWIRGAKLLLFVEKLTVIRMCPSGCSVSTSEGQLSVSHRRCLIFSPSSRL